MFTCNVSKNPTCSAPDMTIVAPKHVKLDVNIDMPGLLARLRNDVTLTCAGLITSIEELSRAKARDTKKESEVSGWDINEMGPRHGNEHEDDMNLKQVQTCSSTGVSTRP